MPSPLLREVNNAVALPAFRFDLDGRSTQGLLWQANGSQPLEEALPLIRVLPSCADIAFDSNQADAQRRRALDDAARIKEPCIYGGHLIRHFGHFCHESLGRLWWLGSGAPSRDDSKKLCGYLQSLKLDVYFFMPKWLDEGKDLLPYMEAILTGLGLPEQRIRILKEPVIFSRLLIPAQVWGFSPDREQIDKRFGCDSLAMMRSLFAGFSVGHAAGTDQRSRIRPARKVFVTRSALPLHLGRPIGDAWLDAVMRRAGYRVFSPELHSIDEQVQVFTAARDLVFVDGSSLYLLWFARLQPGVMVRVILRRRQGAWISRIIRSLLPTNLRLRWQDIDEIIGENLTSEQDWQSHNLLDLAAIARRILGRSALQPSAEGDLALARDLEALAGQLSPEATARILQILIPRVVTGRKRRPHRARHVLNAIRRRVLRLSARLRGPLVPGRNDSAG